MNMEVHVSFKISFWYCFFKYLEVELLDHMVILFLVFWKTSILFSIMTIPIFSIMTTLYSHYQYMRVPFSSSLLSLVFLNSNHSNKCEVISHCGFYFYFWWLVMLQVFPYTHWLFVYLLKIVCSDPLPIFYHNFNLLLSFMNSLYILNVNILSDIWLTNIFSNSID